MRQAISRLRQRHTGKAATRCAVIGLSAALGVLLGTVRSVPAQPCPGDCNGNGEVTIDELITLVDLALGTSDASCPNGDGNGDETITINELLEAVNAALRGCGGVTPVPTATPTLVDGRTPTASATPPDGGTPSPTPPDGATATVTPTADGTVTATATGDPLATATATRTASATATETMADAPTATATATMADDAPTATATASSTVTSTPTQTAPVGPTAPPDATFNDPLEIPLDGNASVTDFVSYPDGDTEDRVRYDVLGLNQTPGLPGGRARLVIAVSCFGTGTNFLEIATGGQQFTCGQTVVDREVTADSRTGTVVITAVGGQGTYVQWVLTGTATRIE